MKILKRIMFFILVIVMLIVLIPLGYYLYIRTYLEGSDPLKVSYLKANANQLEFDKHLDEWFIDNADLTNQIFILGENHGFSINQKIDEQILIYLNKNAGVRYYVTEMSDDNAKLLNKFLTSEPMDISILDSVTKEQKAVIIQQSSKEFFDKWVSIYNYNRTLAEQHKIIVFGLNNDINRTTDEDMYNKFKEIIKKNNLYSEKLYLYLGYFHALQDTVKNSQIPLACKLKNDNYALLSIVNFSLDSEMYFPEISGYPTPTNNILKYANSNGPIFFIKGINDLKEASKSNSTTLFKLNKRNTPYNNCLHLVGYKSIVPQMFGEILPLSQEKSTNDYFQYAILIRDDDASKPYIK